MTETFDIKKRYLFDNLDRCLSQLSLVNNRHGDNQEGAKGLIYILFCHHYGLQVRFHHEMLNWLLNDERKSCVDSTGDLQLFADHFFSFLANGNAQLQKTNEEIYNNYLTNYIYLSDLYYCDVVEHIINSMQSNYRSSCEYSTTPDVAELIGTVVKAIGITSVFDPCAGICEIACTPQMKDVRFYGQEINQYTNLLARIRLLAHEINAECVCEDSLRGWPKNLSQYNALVSEVPFGYMVDQNNMSYESSHGSKRQMIEDLLIQSFLQTPIEQCIMMVPMGFCYRNSNKDLRKKLVSERMLRAVIALPSGVNRNTMVQACLVVIDKKVKHYKVRLIDASDCMELTKQSRKLDVQTIVDRFFGLSQDQTYDATTNDILSEDVDLNPSRYILDYHDILPGQKLVKFKDLTTKVTAKSRFKEEKGRLLRKEDLHTAIIQLPYNVTADDTNNVAVDNVYERKHRKIDIPCVIFNTNCTSFFIKADTTPLFVTSGYNCFTVNVDKCDLKYFIHVMLTSQKRKEAATVGIIPRIRFDTLKLPIYEDIDSQKAIVGRIYREEKSQLQEKLSSLAKLGDGSQSLIHDLGFTFTKISAGLSLLSDIENQSLVSDMKANVAFALRQINRKGTDFANVVPSFIEHDIVSLIHQYIIAWKAFGYNNFNIDEPIISGFDTAEETIIMADEDLFYSMLDCVFLNAYQHGFLNNPSMDHRISIRIKAVSNDEKRYALISIANNGEPLPIGFTVADFIQRGVTGYNSMQDGIGGDHINKIAHKHGGFVDIYQNDNWCCCDIFIPVYLTSPNSNYEEYEFNAI